MHFKDLHSCFCLFVVVVVFKYLIIYFTYSVPETYCLSNIGCQEAYSS